MKYQTMRIDRLKHLNIEALIGNVELTVSGETLTIVPVAQEKKPRTKAEYVPCKYIDAWEPVKAYFDGDELFDSDESKVTCPEVALNLWIHGSLYRRIETPMTEREMFIEGVEKIGAELTENGDWSFACLAAEIFDSKLVN